MPSEADSAAAIAVISFDSICEIVTGTGGQTLSACHMTVLSPPLLQLDKSDDKPLIIFNCEELETLDFPRDRPFLLDEISIGVLLDVFIENQRPPEHRDSALSLICHQTMNLHRSETVTDQTKPVSPKRSPVSEIEAYLKAHLDEPITLNDLLRRFRCSATHLCRRMQAAGKPPPMKRLAELRLEKARFLLRQKDISISHVAAQVGMSDLAAFSHFFKRHCGKSPTEFQQSINWLL